MLSSFEVGSGQQISYITQMKTLFINSTGPTNIWWVKCDCYIISNKLRSNLGIPDP